MCRVDIRVGQGWKLEGGKAAMGCTCECCPHMINFYEGLKHNAVCLFMVGIVEGEIV